MFEYLCFGGKLGQNYFSKIVWGIEINPSVVNAKQMVQFAWNTVTTFNQALSKNKIRELKMLQHRHFTLEAKLAQLP